jgi:biopolymer transport protein ExbD
MSHGPAEGDGRAEPNLVPLLDLVLQLLMFFIMTVNFVTNQVNEKIQLPTMQSARPMDKRETDVLYLNLNADGVLEVLGRDPIKKPSEMRVYLHREFEDARRLARERGKGDEVRTTVIIRADKSVEYKDVFQLLDMCKQVGYRKFQMRAMTRPGATAG